MGAARRLDRSYMNTSTKYSPQRILVVDDDANTRQLSLGLLTGAGYEVEGVKDGAAAWEALQENRYDLIITDNKMPRMTGVELIEMLRSASREVPVIMATECVPTHEFVRKPWLKPNATLASGHVLMMIYWRR